MKLRWLSLALFALVLATAFAPAPFDRSSRRRGQFAGLLSRFQGTWKVEKKERMGPNNDPATISTSQKVVIENSTWRFASSFEGKGGKGGKAPKNAFGGAKGKGKAPSRRYDIVFTPGTYPQFFRLVRGGNTSEPEDYMIGILSVQGDTARVLYRLGRSDDAAPQHPADFESIPQGWYRLTLRRDR